MGFENGKIYKLICSETGNIYIGSTIVPLTRRLAKHKTKSNNCMSKTFINPIIVLIKDFPCNNKEELEAEEVIFIKEVNCVNKVIPGRTSKQWNKDTANERKQYRLDNADKIRERKRKWNLENADKIRGQQQKKYDCECGGKYTHNGRTKHIKTKKHLKFISL